MLVVALFARDSIDYMLKEHFYKQQRYDYSIRFANPVKEQELLNISRLAGEEKLNEMTGIASEKESALGITQRRVPVIISLEETAHLKPGYEVQVAIETGRATKVPLVPLEAVRTGADGQKQVMEVVDGRVKHRTVKTGLSDRDNIEILSGLTPGSVIVRDGSLELKENTKVQELTK